MEKENFKSENLMFIHLLIWLLSTQFILAETDCDWIKIIYKKLGSDISNVDDCCSLDHITCDEESRVITIIWDSTDLTGYLPPEIGNFVNLKHL